MVVAAAAAVVVVAVVVVVVVVAAVVVAVVVVVAVAVAGPAQSAAGAEAAGRWAVMGHRGLALPPVGRAREPAAGLGVSRPWEAPSG